MRAGHPVFVFAMLAALSACTSGTVAPPKAGFTPASRPSGSALIGVDARALQRQFGAPRLDIRDPAVRKLQFANARCVLDTYLYPPSENREPIVTFAEARSVIGAATDTAACAKSLREGR